MATLPDHQGHQKVTIIRLAGQSGGNALNIGGFGGGSNDGMEARIARLEAHMEHVRSAVDKLSDLPERVGKLEAHVSHLPSKGFIVSSTLLALAGIAALSAFVQWVLSAHIIH